MVFLSDTIALRKEVYLGHDQRASQQVGQQGIPNIAKPIHSASKRGFLLAMLLLAWAAMIIAQDSVNVSTIATVPLTGYVMSVAVKGTIAYIAARDESIDNIECSNATATT